MYFVLSVLMSFDPRTLVHITQVQLKNKSMFKEYWIDNCKNVHVNEVDKT